MSDSDCLAFAQRRPYSTLQKSKQVKDWIFDFVTFLAVAQKLGIEFLPITWQSTRQQVGFGGTSQIDQALVNAGRSFVFKRVADKHRWDEAERNIFRVLVNEIIVLRHPLVEAHPNIVALQGVCWDVPLNASNIEETASILPNDDKVWPVLVFEKSEFGDMYHFAQTPIGRGLGIKERLKLCLDTGTAVLDMHVNGVIHGDIKPQNVLIFKEDTGKFTAQVTDFGYSTCYVEEYDLIRVPRSRPWNAPECDSLGLGVKPSQARKMDVFTLGILFLWLVFERHFCGAEPLPKDAQWAISSFGYEGEHRLRDILEDLKNKDGLVLLAHQLLDTENGLDSEEIQGLKHFFGASLACDPNLREANIEDSLKRLNVNRTITIDSAFPDSIALDALESHFELAALAVSLYQSDYRVRSHLTKCLENRVKVFPRDRLTLQLALCYKIGFGTERNDEKSEEMLQRRRENKGLLDDALKEMKRPTMSIFVGTIYRDLVDLGHVSFRGTYEYYLQHNRLEQAKSTMERDLEGLMHNFGDEHDIVLQLKHMLSLILHHEGHWKEAEDLEMQVMNTSSKTFGQEANLTLRSCSTLASIYESQGRWKEAENLYRKIINIRERVIGQEHILTLTNIASLASTFAAQGRWEAAAKLEAQVVETTSRVLGQEHPLTMSSKGNLASSYLKLGRWKEAEELEVDVLNTTLRVLGQEHPAAFASQANLALTLSNQGRWKEAEELGLKVIETTKRVLGPEHADTLLFMGNLASMHQGQGNWDKAEKLQVQVKEANSRILGLEHPDTLTSINNLASTYQYQERWKEAEDLQLELTERMSRVLGEEHPETLISMMNLASTYQHQRLLTEAEELQSRVLETSLRMLGEAHPFTLTSMSNQASTYVKQKRWKEAEILDIQVMETRKRVLKLEHPDTITSMDNLAFLYRKQKRWEEAETLQREVLEIRSRLFGPRHRDTMNSMGNLAVILKSQDKDEEAVALMLQCVDFRKITLGVDHPTTRKALKMLDKWLI